MIVETGGWCAPSGIIFEPLDCIQPEVWPVGLTEWDLRWIAEMLWVGEIWVAPSDRLELPIISIRRGGVRWPVTA